MAAYTAGFMVSVTSAVFTVRRGSGGHMAYKEVEKVFWSKMFKYCYPIPSLKRFVQPVKSEPKANQSINQSINQWPRSGSPGGPQEKHASVITYLLTAQDRYCMCCTRPSFINWWSDTASPCTSTPNSASLDRQ